MKCNKFKIKKYQIVIVIIIVILLAIAGIIWRIYYNKVTITDECINQYFRENVAEEEDFQNSNANIIGISDIQYNNYNKLVLVNLNENNQSPKTYLVLANKKENDFKYIHTSGEMLCLLNGVSNSNVSNNVPKVLEISCKYIENKGIDFFLDGKSEDYKNLFNEITAIDGINKCRQYIKNMIEPLVDNEVEYIVLFEKGTAIVKYMADYEETLEFNSKYPMTEGSYELMEKYGSSGNLRSLKEIYGPPYIVVKKYNIYSMETTETERVGSYDTLEKAKKQLNVEE